MTGYRSLLYLLAKTMFDLYVVLYPTFVVGILTVLFTVSETSISGVGRHFHYRSLLESPRYTLSLPASLPWSNVVGSSLECWWYMS